MMYSMVDSIPNAAATVLRFRRDPGNEFEVVGVAGSRAPRHSEPLSKAKERSTKINRKIVALKGNSNLNREAAEQQSRERHCLI